MREPAGPCGRQNGYGVPAFNVNNAREQVQPVMEAAKATASAPFIMQASCRVPRKYAGEGYLEAVRSRAAVVLYARKSPVVMHQDQRPKPRCVSRRHQFGLQLGHDGRQALWKPMAKPSPATMQPRGDQESGRQWPHKSGITAEGEFGLLRVFWKPCKATKKTAMDPCRHDRDQLSTDPEQAADFAQAPPQLDALAIAIGTSHGAYKFTRKPTGDIFAIDRIASHSQTHPQHPFGSYDSSSVPQDLLEIIRKYGGDIKGNLRRTVGREFRRPSGLASAKSTSTPTSGLAMTAARSQVHACKPPRS